MRLVELYDGSSSPVPDIPIWPAFNDGRISDICWDMPGTGWANTEYRSYVFEAGVDGDDSDAGIRETRESRKRRGKTTPQPSRKDQKHMFWRAMQQWEDQGMQDGEKVGWRKDKQDGEEPATGVVPAEARTNGNVKM